MNETVNNPKHYNSHKSGIECIDLARLLCFSLGNALKYAWRADLKNGREDLEKCVWYLTDEFTNQRQKPLPKKSRDLFTYLCGRVLDSEPIASPLASVVGWLHHYVDGLAGDFIPDEDEEFINTPARFLLRATEEISEALNESEKEPKKKKKVK